MRDDLAGSGSCCDLRVLLPHLVGVAIDSIDVAGGGVSIHASPLSVSASCPTCGDTSERVHSRYERTVADAAIGNRPSRLVLRVRRFLCSSTACDRRTFAEQIDGVTMRYARRTPLLRGTLERIGLALAGRAGARLATALACTSDAAPCYDLSVRFRTAGGNGGGPRCRRLRTPPRPCLRHRRKARSSAKLKESRREPKDSWTRNQ